MKSIETGLRQAEALNSKMNDLRERLEKHINLKQYTDNHKNVSPKGNAKLMRICLLAGLSDSEKRNKELLNIQMSSNSIHPTLFTVHNLNGILSSMIKLRYHDVDINWDDNVSKSKVVNAEIFRGFDLLMKADNLLDWLKVSTSASIKAGQIPFLNLNIGSYEGEINAYLDMNSKNITNTQILIAGTTGSGKSNLLAVLMNEMRSLSVESNYPVNFLFFDYKGEFSDINNNHWLQQFEVNRSAILDPMLAPLPFTPFKDFTGKTQGEINQYSTELGNTLCAIDKATISANMSNRLSEAIINTYKITKGKSINFSKIIDSYTDLQPAKDRDKMDSIKSVLSQLERSNLFLDEDRVNLINNSYIVKMDKFSNEGPIGKAIVYFIVSKLNSIYENLPGQANDTEKVELRHFTIIDEAHYMLDFPNRPLKDLIAVGRNKGMSIILATQNMDAYKSKHFDFYANAQYPLIMKQQSINDGVLKDMYGVAGNELMEIKQAIAGLQKGELIIKNNDAILMGIGKKYKKIMVRHLI
jgi:energy-coupling factor transporter ATP-binding protein EcfA2